MKRKLIVVMGALLLAFMLVAAVVAQTLPVHPAAVAVRPQAVTAATIVFINEIHYDNAGTDTGEGVEIAGPAGTDLTGWSIILYNGSGGASYNTKALSGTIPDQQAGYGTVFFTYPTDGLQNGAPDGLALLDPISNVIQFLSYEGVFTATNGPANGMRSTDIVVSETSSTPVGYSLQLQGTGSVYEDFTWGGPISSTYDAVNTGQTFVIDLLKVAKQGPSSAVAGDTITYTIVLSNVGTATATATTITDTLPTEVTFVTYTTSLTPTFSIVGNQLVWGLGDVLSQTNDLTIQVRATISSSLTAGTLFTNTVNASTTATETVMGNNAASTTTLIGAPDLVVVKSGAASVNAGDAITFTLTYSNAGNLDATNVVLVDQLPGAMTYVTDSLGSGVYANGVITWNIGGLNVGASNSIVLTATALYAGDWQNRAAISGGPLDSDLTNNTSIVTTTINGVDPFVFKTGPTVSFGGEVLSATITYGNHGNQAVPVTITDLLPIGFTTADIAADTSGLPFVDGANTRAWTTTVAADSSVSFTFALTVPTTITSTTRVTNTATIASTGAGNNPIDDVSILAGAVYQIVPITNARAGAVSQIFAVEGRVTYVPGTYNASGWGVQDNSGGIAVFYTPPPTITLGDRVRLVATRQLNGAEKQLTSPVYYFANLGSGPQVDPTPFSTGAVVSGTADGWLAVISGTVSGLGTCTGNYSFNVNDGSGVTTVFVDLDTHVDVCAMGIVNGDGIRVVGFGTLFGTLYEIKPRFPADVIEYPRVLSVNPINNATGVTITTAITAAFNMTMTNVSTSTFTLQGPGGAVTGTVAFDTVTKAATFTPSANLALSTRYTATLKSTLLADNGLTLFPAQDFVWSFTTYQPAPNLSVAKSVATPHTPALLGDVVTYVITLTNSGDANATGVVLTDVLPSEVTFGGFVTPAPAGTVQAGNAITWTGTANLGSSVTWTFTATIGTGTSLYGHVVTNTASFASANAGSGSANANFNIVTGPNLSASTKVASPTGALKPGDLVTYTITLSNTGGVNASAHVTDVLGSYYTVYNALDFTQNPTGTLTWTGVVTAGQSVTLRFVAQVKSLTQLPIGLTNLINDATLDDGIHAPFVVHTTTAPTVRIYGIFVPLVRR